MPKYLADGVARPMQLHTQQWAETILHCYKAFTLQDGDVDNRR